MCDIQAFTHLYNHLFPGVYYFARRLVGKGPEAEDIVAETFEKLWRIRPNFNTYANIKAFLYITARNACLDLLRARWRHRLAHLEIVYLEIGEHTAKFSEDEYHVFRQKLSKAVEMLPAQPREVFKLMYMEGLSTAVVAGAMGLSPQTVLNHKSRAINLLRNMQAGNGPGLDNRQPSPSSRFCAGHSCAGGGGRQKSPVLYGHSGVIDRQKVYSSGYKCSTGF